MPDHLHILIDGFLEGSLTDEQTAQLLSYLNSSDSALEQVRALLVIDEDLRQLASPTANAKAFRAAVMARCEMKQQSNSVETRSNEFKAPTSNALANKPKFIHRSSAERNQFGKRPSRRRFPAQALAALVMVGAVLAVASFTAYTVSDQTAMPKLESLGRIDSFSGWVSVEQGDQARSPTLGSMVQNGDRLVTGADGQVTVQLPDGTRLMLEKSSWLLLPAQDGARARLERGSVSAIVSPQTLDAPPILSTPTTSIRVLGTSFRASVADVATQVEVAHGIVEIRGLDQRNWQVKAGESLRLVDGTIERTSALDLRLLATDPWHSIAARTLPPTSSSKQVQVPPTDKWGARTDRTLSTSGRIHVERSDGRWWAVSPEGHPLLLLGITDVSHELGFNDPNFKAVFPTTDDWARSARSLLSDHGFNNFGSRSDAALLNREGQTRGESTRVVAASWIAHDFAQNWIERHARWSSVRISFQTVQMLAPLLPGFQAQVNSWADQLPTRFKDGQAIALVTDQFPKVTFKWQDLRKLAQNDAAINIVLQDWLKQRGKNWDNANQDDVNDLRIACLSGYRDIVHVAARKAMPQTLFMGQIMKLQELTDPLIAQHLCRDVDAVAINLIGALVDSDTLRQASNACQRPLWIESLYAKGADSGLPNRDGRGFEVRTQADRGRYYQHLALEMLESRVVIGWQWFRYEDVGENPTDAKKIYVTNKGVVDAQFKPYSVLLDAMATVNRLRYVLCDRFDAPEKPTVP